MSALFRFMLLLPIHNSSAFGYEESILWENILCQSRRVNIPNLFDVIMLTDTNIGSDNFVDCKGVTLITFSFHNTLLIQTLIQRSYFFIKSVYKLWTTCFHTNVRMLGYVIPYQPRYYHSDWLICCCFFLKFLWNSNANVCTIFHHNTDKGA